MKKRNHLLILVLFFWIQFLGAQKTITGNVQDEKGKALIGVIVSESSDPNHNTLTDLNGEFSLMISSTATSLKCIYLGYKDRIFALSDNNKKVSIMMEENAQLLNEVLVVGYGKSTKRTMTDNVAKLASKDISNIAVSNFQSTMSGKAAGVRINQTSGKIESGINIRIRGASSISSGTEPLYVLDGVPLINVNESNNGAPVNPLLSISPSEIESIEILKDASSAAIYGARASNGVILITTKKGAANTSTISLNVSTGNSSPTHLVQWLNTKQYKELFTEAAKNTLGEVDGQAEIEGTFDYLANGTDWKNNAISTDWNKLIFRNGHQSDLDLNFSGGDSKTSYFFAGAANKTTGIIIGNDLDKLNARTNLSHQFSSKFTSGINLAYNKTKIERVDNDNSLVTPSEAIAQSPLSPAYDSLGNINPNTLYPSFLLEDKFANYTTNVRRLTGKLFGEYKIFQNLKFNSDFGYDLSTQTEDQYRGRKTPFMSTNGFAYRSNALSENYIWSNYATFDPKINDDIKLSIIAGHEFNQSKREFNSVTGIQFPSDDFHEISSAAEITEGKGFTTAYNFLSYFTRANFQFKEKYLLKASLRRDGSSRFGTNKRFGTFPALSAGWILSQENFLAQNNLISFLKLRASYGQSGNSEIGNFASRTLYEGHSYKKISGISLFQAGNNDLTWEKINQFDVGLDFGILKNRIYGELDYYKKNSTSLIFNVPTPGSSGQTSIVKNIGSLESKGVEFVLNTKNLVDRKLTWTTSFNLANNSNKITSLPNNNSDIINSTSINRVGSSIFSFYLVEYAGVDPSNGDALFYKNGKGTETTKNFSEAKRVVAGNPQPNWIGGLTNEIAYKGIALNFTFVGEWGAHIYNSAGIYQSANGSYYDNQTIDQLNRWQKTGDITNVPQARLYDTNGSQNSTRYLQSANFIRLRNIALSYQIPSAITHKLRIQSARIYLSGVNLITFTKYNGYDPESRFDENGSGFDRGQNFYSVPQAKTTSFGINLNF